MTLKNVFSGKHWWKNLLTSVQPKHCTTKYNPNLVEKNKCVRVCIGGRICTNRHQSSS